MKAQTGGWFIPAPVCMYVCASGYMIGGWVVRASAHAHSRTRTRTHTAFAGNSGSALLLASGQLAGLHTGYNNMSFSYCG